MPWTNNDSYRTVWKVLQALRAHDDHFKAEINSLEFGKSSRIVRATGSKEHHEKKSSMQSSQVLQTTTPYLSQCRKCAQSSVDFIISSADWAVREKLSIPQGLAAKGVHILDPFSGTGTLMAGRATCTEFSTLMANVQHSRRRTPSQ